LLPGPRARQISLTASERRGLKKLACSRTVPCQQVIRVRIVLDAACGYSNAKIARLRGVTVDTVRTWRGRYADEGLAGLTDRRRSGRPARFTPVQLAEVKALACQLPAETGVPLARWSCPDLATEAIGRGITVRLSPPGVLGRRQRILPPRPSRHRPPRQAIPRHGHGPHARARLVAESGRAT
jgi:hypothetical protein